LDGTLPLELSVLSQLRELIVTSNRLVGTLPTTAATTTTAEPQPPPLWPLLETLDVEDNALTGPHPWSLFVGQPNLRRVHLSDNTFDSDTTTTSTITTLAQWLTSSASLIQELWMSNSNYRGTLPTELGLLSALGTSRCLLVDTCIACRDDASRIHSY
jgi:hypothetical protein